MEAQLLPPPREVGPDGRGPRARRRRPEREDRLGAPQPAHERRRPLFHPATGWFRRAERAASQWLDVHVWPRVPGATVPYGRILDRRLVLSHARVVIDGLPAAFEGLRILLVTDVHAGPFVAPPALETAFARLAATEPDLIVLGGDLTTGQLSEFRDHERAFRSLRAPLGVWAVRGNHDHYTEDPARLAAMVEACGIGVLDNRAVELRSGGAGLWLAGIDDLLIGAPDLDRALAAAKPPVVLVSHNPDVLFEAARRDVALVLSGHTHAGQIRIPGCPVLVRQSRYRLDGGRYRAGRTELVVSRGLGAVGIPVRIACPPEAVLLELVAPGRGA